MKIKLKTKTMKGLGAVSIMCVFLISGCSGARTIGVQRNNAGTQSVRLSSSSDDSQGAPAAAPVIKKLEPVNNLSDNGPIEIKEKLFIAQTNDIYLNAEDYMGKTIKLEGLFKSVQYEGEHSSYCFVLRYGPGCCGNDGSAGFEVAWETRQEEGDKAPYPDIDEWVEAVGTLKTYEEDGYPYLYLALSSLNVLDERGAEFVTQ
jgi:uncharacterized membrane protein YcgQ (UPF0703/DUF1980 family)